MVLIIRGYDPTEVGLRKFLTEPEMEVLSCLWEKGKDGCSAKALKECLDSRGHRHSPATINKTLKGLSGRGIVASRVVVRSAPLNMYYPIVAEGELSGLLVGQLVSSLYLAMPEAVARAAGEF